MWNESFNIGEIMALLFADNFHHLASLEPKFSMVGTYYALSTAKTRKGVGQSCRLTYTGSLGIGDSFFTPKSELFIGFAVYMDQTGFTSQSASLFNFVGSSASNFSATWYYGSLLVYNGVGQLIARVKGFSAYGWNYVEASCKPSNSSSAGDCKIRINGQEVFSCDAGEDFLHSNNIDSNIYIVRLGCTTGGTTVYGYITDVYICDSSGSVNNTFLGDCSIETLYPNANGNNSDFMGSDGNQTDNYLLVDDATHTGDTDYVYDDTVDQIDLYGFDNLTEAIQTIHGVIVEPTIRKDDGGGRTARAMIRRSSTNYEGAELFPSTSYNQYPTVWEQDPSTSSAWAETGVNSAEFGLTIES